MQTEKKKLYLWSFITSLCLVSRRKHTAQRNKNTFFNTTETELKT